MLYSNFASSIPLERWRGGNPNGYHISRRCISNTHPNFENNRAWIGHKCNILELRTNMFENNRSQSITRIHHILWNAESARTADESARRILWCLHGCRQSSVWGSFRFRSGILGWEIFLVFFGASNLSLVIRRGGSWNKNICSSFLFLFHGCKKAY